MKSSRLSLLAALALAFLAPISASAAGVNTEISDDQTFGYLFCHMSSYGQYTAFALSPDGIHFHDLLCGSPMIETSLARIEGGMRTPYICRAANGGFLMVCSDNNAKYRLGKASAEDNYGIDLLTSATLYSWNSRSFDFRKGAGIFQGEADAYKDWSGVTRVWAPQIIRDEQGYVIYFSMFNPGEERYDKIYFCRADDSFSTLTAPKLLADAGFGVTNPDIQWLPAENKYRLTMNRVSDGALVYATSANLTGPWSPTTAVTPEKGLASEGFSAFRVVGEEGWRVGYYSKGSEGCEYRVCRASEDFGRFFSAQEIEGIDGPQQGSFIRLTKEEYESLQAWSDAQEHIYLKKDNRNPVFPGLWADPDVLYSNKTGKYYIYPTTDGSYQWHNYYFHCFSSSDFKNWTDEGIILDLRELDWGKEYAWAPCIIEKPVLKGLFKKKIVDYKYYYYFVANKSIGVAVSDNPAGPFIDVLGKPLLSQEEINSPNIVIDPDVFQDPATGKYYLYWGNSYMWMAELNDDLVSFVPGTMHEMIPRSKTGEYHYLEGTYVFERNGLYYFMWSENITRSTNYRIRYLISDSPTEFVRNGQPAKVEDEIILQLDPTKQIFGTGHNSAIRMPGTDDWYMVYHRFTRPEGVKMGLSGGYNREICIDKMEFREDGTIIPVRPTL